MQTKNSTVRSPSAVRNALSRFRRFRGGGLMEYPYVQALADHKWSIALVAMAFLLGRAMILEQLSPFALAYFAVIYYLRRELLLWTSFSLLAGNLLAVQPQIGHIAVQLGVFYLIQQALGRYDRTELSHAPMIVFISSFSVRLFSYMVNGNLTWFSLMMTSIESVLGFVLTLIFIQALPVFTLKKKNTQLRNEEIICLIILLGSVMTGTVGWLIGPVSVEHVLSRYLILLFALVGGAPLGASVGVVTGLILSLADIHAVQQMSLLAFAGLLAGLLKEGKKAAVSIGLMLGASILSVYIGSQDEVLVSTLESGTAVLLLFLTPKSLISLIAKFVPGTQENLKSQYEYAKKVREITAGRVEQFSEVFRQLAGSFKHFGIDGQEVRKDEEMGHFMNSIADRSCTSCWKREKCWETNFFQTYKFMTDMMTSIEENPGFSKEDIPVSWTRICVKSEAVMDIMKQQYDLYKHDRHWRKQINDSRHLVAEQLSGVSQVMQDLAMEIKREGQEMHIQEEQIRLALEKLGLSIHTIDIVSLEEGNVEIEIVHQYTKGFDECRKIIAPLLSDIMGENIVVKSEQYSDRKDGCYRVVFGSAKEFDVETGIAAAAKGGALLSGDSYSAAELGNGKFAVALSDGMGNGERAKMESSAALAILRQLLQTGMEEKLAIKSVNSVLALRSSDEVFATIDMALVDLYSAKTTFLKIGSSPSFIKRGGEVIPVSANNLPVGILQDIDIDLVSVQLKPGDILFMLTDGIYDAPGPAVNKELWMKRMIQEIEAETPQEIADCLLEKVVRYHHGDIYDDMTVVVAKIEKFRPEWSTIRWPGVSRIERPKTVS
ncbi:stage II sporulation protein E [Ferviditalea candida]|uniref:Stage II sporulation protein E n=1 Tax=Ferviditalea candida TaxID=3108399 RepID=A0ABU5ZL83_9BACL|nr:stage II sporulation protein E [Paenibacillaceae bacterium T2]